MSTITIRETDDTERVEEYDPDGERSLSQLQEAVGGLIKIVPIPGDDIMLANEEGLLKRLPLNTYASQLAGRVIVGPVVIMRDEDLR